MASPRRAIGAVTACATVIGLGLTGLAAFTGSASADTTNLVANPGFETGSLANWSCSAGTASVVSSPVHSGTHALSAAPTSGDTAQCTQTISVQPNSSYSLSAWVQGPYVYLGTSGDGTTDVSTWSNSSSWNQLSTTFKTGASTTSVTIYLHGWYGQGAYQADDVTLSGAAGATTAPPTTAPPTTTPPTTAPPTTAPPTTTKPPTTAPPPPPRRPPRRPPPRRR
ncbi:carbohydrate binding domain-containing protein [Streptacidiphilus sp. PAMC 29251]